MSEVTVTIANAEATLTKLESDYTAAKSKIVAVVQAHVTAHQQAAAAHQAEVSAAQALLAKADPTLTPTANQAAAIILTSSTQVQDVIIWVAKQWRWLTLGVSVAMLAYGFHAGLL
jgi:maltodextrin utilization protein YvdJ